MQFLVIKTAETVLNNLTMSRLEDFYCYSNTNITLCRSLSARADEVVSFLEEHLNIKSDSSEPQSETGWHLCLCTIIFEQLDSIVLT